MRSSSTRPGPDRRELIHVADEHEMRASGEIATRRWRASTRSSIELSSMIEDVDFERVALVAREALVPA
jgi:hypothetical protein